ncbi:hypothetical protein [Pseudonocardia sp. HH130630-07]|uniref:hypothetical protein n=1 Tax=Pseudonocardia sp. HH130630-07 TaxID=1690815 RepID=UPI0008151EA6|nr:hypothetical protein [Pseudonocardia sp. HH130630-07]ANY06860.1 hypothetical protein AFB00_11790 [Pseudonocardia sp. HH130630-07]
MPIRSPRGRAAAYRAVWQWPLRSPVRLAFSVVVLAGLVFGLVFLGGQLGAGTSGGGSSAGGQQDERRDAAGSGISATPTPTMLPPVTPLTPDTLPVDQAPPQALEAARVWASSWVNHPEGMTPQQWIAGLRPHTTDEFLGVLAGVDPANVPAARVTGPAVAVRVAPKSVEAEVPTDTLRLSVLVVSTEAGWKVSRYDRV